MMKILKTQNIAKRAAKRTAAVGVSSVSCHSLSVSKIVDFMSAEPFGSAFFVSAAKTAALASLSRAPLRVIPSAVEGSSLY